MRIRITHGLRNCLIAGAATGLVGVCAFGVAHAYIISPIWSSLPGGLPLALVSGCALGWAFHELRSSGKLSASLRGGLAFGLLLWLMLVPMNAFAALLRVTGLRDAIIDIEPVFEIAIALATGAAAGWLLTRARRPAVALAAAALALTILMGGPVPITTSTQAASFFASFAAVYVVSGIALAIFASALTKLTRCRHEDARDSELTRAKAAGT